MRKAIRDRINRGQTGRRYRYARLTPTSYEMLGAYLREVSALILVFAPLDRLLQNGEISTSWWVGTVLLSLLFLLIGIALEQG